MSWGERGTREHEQEKGSRRRCRGDKGAGDFEEEQEQEPDQEKKSWRRRSGDS